MRTPRQLVLPSLPRRAETAILIAALILPAVLMIAHSVWWYLLYLAELYFITFHTRIVLGPEPELRARTDMSAVETAGEEQAA